LHSRPVNFGFLNYGGFRMRKMIFLAIALLTIGFCATTDVQVSGVSGKINVSAATPGSPTLLAHILRRRRVG
jgi:hypothetical protein